MWIRAHGLVVMTLPSRGKGPEFESRWAHQFFYSLFTFELLDCTEPWKPLVNEKLTESISHTIIIVKNLYNSK